MTFEPTEKEIEVALAAKLKFNREHGYEVKNLEMLRNMVIANLKISKQYANAVADKPEFVREVSLTEVKDFIKDKLARFETNGFYKMLNERLKEIRDVIHSTYFADYSRYENAPYVVFAHDDNGKDRFFMFNHTKNMFVPVCVGGYTCLASNEVNQIIKKYLN